MDDPRIEFLGSINVDLTRVKKFPGFIFLCGGPTPTPLSVRPYRSLRHQLMDYISSNEINLGAPTIVAESFGEWLNFGTYDDLITFERHLAGVANIIPIILESPGAIAELGAFSQEPAIKEKLLVFRQERYSEDPSFINFGLLRFIEREDRERVQTYPWAESTGGDIKLEAPVEPTNSTVVTDMTNDIINKVKYNSRKSKKFRNDDHGHIMILIEDIIKLMIGLTVSEIVKFINIIGINIDDKTVTQYLFLLTKLGIVGDKHYGSRFYFSKRIWDTHIDYAFRDGRAPFDRGAFMQNIEKY